jgi:hypothetical protein
MTVRRYDEEGNPIDEPQSQNLAQPQTDVSLEQLLQMTEAKMQGQFPMMVDSATRLDSVSVDSSTLHYHYALLNATSEELDVEATRAALEPMVRKQAAEMSFLKLLMDKGATISFHYADKDGKEIAAIDVKGDDAG